MNNFNKRKEAMLAPKFLIEKFKPNTPASVWFCSNINRGAMRGLVRGWEEHGEELTSYLLFELPNGNALYLPFSDIYLAELTAVELDEAKADHELEKRVKMIGRKQSLEQIEQAERGGSRIAPPPMGGPMGGRLM
jgi:hypothetical protein